MKTPGKYGLERYRLCTVQPKFRRNRKNEIKCGDFIIQAYSNPPNVTYKEVKIGWEAGTGLSDANDLSQESQSMSFGFISGQADRLPEAKIGSQ